METIKTFWEYREFFKNEMRRLFKPATAESMADYKTASLLTPLNERLIQAIWSNQLIQPEGLKLADGRPVRVLDPGRWNGSAGPDFRSAKLMIDSQILTGDVEIHIQSSEWRAHRHEADLDYNNVILHAVHQNDDGGTTDRLHNGQTIPRLELEPYLFPDLETIRRSMTADDFTYDRPAGLGKCHDLMTDAPAELVADFLDRAGDERLTAKIRRLEDQLQGTADPSALEQVFYQSLMMSLGTGSGKSLYYLLAKRTPPIQIEDYVRDLEPDLWRMGIEAILLHVAGILPLNQEESAEAPEESRQYALQLGELWKNFEPYWSDRRMTPTRRWYRGIRPVNFPTRRLTAVAELLYRGLCANQTLLADLSLRVKRGAASLKDAKPSKRLHPLLKELIAWFEVDSTPSFWSNHYSFAAKAASRPMALLGDSTSRSLVFNAVIPALALSARLRGDDELAFAARKLYSIFPPLQSNHITEFMTRRLFGESRRSDDLLTTERRRQALFQIFYSCCNGEERHCDRCYFLTQT